MATSGSFTGARGGSGTGPYMTLSWQRIDVDIAGNRSLVRLWLTLHSNYSLNFSASKSGVLYGNSFTYTGGFSGTGSRDVKSIDVWIGHDSDGQKSQYVQGDFNISISWGGNWVGTLSVGGTIDLDRIPRASNVSLSSTNFTMGDTITIHTNRVSTAFTHTVVYVFGGATANIAFNVTDNCTWKVPLDLAWQIPNAMSGIGSIICHTYSGGTHIGTSTIGFTAHVPGSMKPNVSGLGISIAGEGRDQSLGKYIQSISKVYANFQASGTYGSSIPTARITIRRQSDGANAQVISGYSGVTSNPLALSGVYDVIVDVWDSRGMYNGMSTYFNVEPYSPPTISKFYLARWTPTTTVGCDLTASWSLGSMNPAHIKIVGVNNAGVSKDLFEVGNNTAGSISNQTTTIGPFTGQSDASSFTYTITITDSFGNVARATSTLGTAFVEFTIAKGKGIGVGKVWEQGAADIGGDTHVSGNIYIKEHGNTIMRPLTKDNSGSSIYATGIDMNNDFATGFYQGDNTNPNRPPIGGWYWFQVQRHNNLYCVQTAWDFGSLRTFERRKTNGTWSGWRQVFGLNPTASLSAGGQGLAANTWYRVDWNIAYGTNEHGFFEPDINQWYVTDDGYYEVMAWTYFVQSIQTGFYLEVWSTSDPTFEHRSLISTWAPANGYNFYHGSNVMYCKQNHWYEIVVKHSDTNYSRSILDMKATVKRL